MFLYRFAEEEKKNMSQIIELELRAPLKWLFWSNSDKIEVMIMS